MLTELVLIKHPKAEFVSATTHGRHLLDRYGNNLSPGKNGEAQQEDFKTTRGEQ